jgi:hypothetical protein
MKDTRERKMAKLSGKMALRSAEIGNDPDVKKLRKLQAAMKKLKARIQKKWKSKADAAAREALSKM